MSGKGSRLRPPKGKPPRGAVRVVQKAAHREQDQAPRAEVAPATKATGEARRSIVTGRRPAALAWAQLTRPLATEDGIRLLFFGVTGSGKTTGIKDLLKYIVDNNLIDLVLIHDVKKPEKQYDGEVVHEARQILTTPPTTYPAVRVMRKRGLDHMPSVEDAARVTLEAGYDGHATMLVIDEFQRALTDGGKFESQSVRRIFCEGLGLHASVIAGKQLPQLVPTEATGQSSKIYFRESREGTNYLVDDKKMTKELADVVVALPTGSFIMMPEERDFDGFIYEVPAP